MVEHVLSTLSLPSRYEPLVNKIGVEVLRLLHPPAAETLHVLEEAAEAVRSLEEGLFLPIYAKPGTGKSTLAENLTLFLGDRFTPTLSFKGDLSAGALNRELEAFRARKLTANDERVVPVNIDHREGKPASSRKSPKPSGFCATASDSAPLPSGPRRTPHSPPICRRPTVEWQA